MNLKYEVGQSVAIEVPKTITETVTEIISEQIRSITIGASGAKYLTSKGAFTEEQLDSYAQPAQEEPAQPKPKFKVGDTVKIASVRPNTWNTQGKMDEHLGKVVKITAIYGGNYFKFAGSEPWRFCLNDVEPYTEPAQPKAEPIKLYCVKDCFNWFTKGKIYELTIDGNIVFDTGRVASGCGGYKSLEQFVKMNPQAQGCLIPLVSRPAKVGEWVLVTDQAFGFTGHHKGEIFKVVETAGSDDVRIDLPKQHGVICMKCEYLVLDGYKPEPEAEPEPEYYNGKVVCVDNGFIATLTVGKVYEVKDGFFYNDAGRKNPLLTGAIKTLEDMNARRSAKFIEFKGE